MPDIRQLPPHIVNQIAAGEVIERPASVVKELLENAVDAGADRIHVSIEQGGLARIRVADNGSGIPADQLELAVASHATSKLADAEDLFGIRTLGFRGEALASIAAVSRLTVRSRTADSDSGAEIRVDGGMASATAPCAAAVGTSVEVAELFFNTPVRRKFLRTTQTEVGHVCESLIRVALAWPSISFVLEHNERTIYELPATDQWAERIRMFFGDDVAAALIPVASHDGPVTIAGFVCDPSVDRGHNRTQYLFLNGRFIRDRSLQHALGEAYRGLLMTGRFGLAFLRLDMPPESVDVNVHPAKLEVRFQDASRLYSQLLGTIRDKFLTTNLTAKVAVGAPRSPFSPSAGEWARPPVAGVEPAVQMQFGGPADAPARDAMAVGSRGDWLGRVSPDRAGAASATERSDWDPAGPHAPGTWRAEDWPAGAPYSHTTTESALHEPRAEDFSAARLGAMQIHDRYLVTQSDEGIIVIDQHALHERILYEDLREKVTAGGVEAQRLLVPEPVTLTAGEAAVLLDASDALEPLGIRVEPFGGTTVLVTTYPAMLSNQGVAETLRSVVELLVSSDKTIERRDLVDDLLHMIACKAAVKAGDRLTPAEIHALVERRHLCQDAHHCPHGRPTALVFSRDQLDRWFKRI